LNKSAGSGRYILKANGVYYEKSFNDTGYFMPWQMFSDNRTARHFRTGIRDCHPAYGGAVYTYNVQKFHMQRFVRPAGADHSALEERGSDI
jgi:hypothetical protein